MQPIKNADLKNADIYKKTPENMKNMKNKVSGKSRKTNRISKKEVPRKRSITIRI